MEVAALTTPFSKDIIAGLVPGQKVLISGTIYMARDAAHKRMVAALDRGEPLPFDPVGQVIYHAGPCPAKPGAVIGSCRTYHQRKNGRICAPVVGAGPLRHDWQR